MFIDYLKEYLISYHLYIQLVPAILGLLFIKKMDIEYRFFIGLLWYSILNEIIALYVGLNLTNGYNKIFYNIFNIVYFMFLFWLFYRKTINPQEKTTIKVTILLFISVTLYEMIFLQNYYRDAGVLSFITGGFGVLICVYYYFLNVLLSEKSINMMKDFLFWVTLAHFIYYIGFTPIKITENYFEKFYLDDSQLRGVKIIVTSIKLFLLTFGLIVCHLRKTP